MPGARSKPEPYGGLSNTYEAGYRDFQVVRCPIAATIEL